MLCFPALLYPENHSLGEWFQKDYVDEVEIKTPFAIMKMRSANCINKQKEDIQMKLNDIHSLSHIKWSCKYHVILALKQLYPVFHEEKCADFRKATGYIQY